MESDAVVDSVAVAGPVVVVGTDEGWVLELDLESSYQRMLLVVVESGPELEHFVADVESAADYVADPAAATAVDDFVVVVVVVVVVVAVEASS